MFTMANARRALCTTTLLLLICVIAGCSIPKDEITIKSEIPISSEESPVFLALMEDNSVLFYLSDGDKISIYLYDGEKILRRIGNIDNYYLDTGVTALLKGHVYMYATLVDNMGRTYNALCDIDVKLGTVTIMDKEYDTLPGVNVYATEEDIVSLKTSRTNDEIITYIDKYNPETKTWRKISEKAFNESKQSGEAINAICTDGEGNIYSLEDYYDEDGKCTHHLTKYDNTYEQNYRKKLKGACNAFVDNTENRIVELKVFDKFLYLRDLSSNGFIGSIVDDMTAIQSGEEIMAAISSIDAQEMLFYIRGTEKAYLIDTENNKLTPLEMDLQKDSTLLQIWTNRDSYLVVTIDDEWKQTQRIIDKR